MKIGLFDSNFSHASTCGNGDLKIQPKSFDWARSEIHDINVFTDNELSKVDKNRSRINIALILEPPAVRKNLYQANLYGAFDLTLSFDKDFCSTVPKSCFYALGGTWIKPEDWKLWDKKYNVSLIVSSKNYTPGHELRHSIRSQLSNKIDFICGRDIHTIPYKLEALSPYRYSIVVENGKYDYYFSEKLIDCFVTGTIPIYWGCPSIDKFFLPEGILQFNSIEELSEILKGVSEEDYRARYSAVRSNFQKALEYTITEDWLYWNIFYPKFIRRNP